MTDYETVVRTALDEEEISDVSDVYRNENSANLSDRGRRSLTKEDILPEGTNIDSTKLQYLFDSEEFTGERVATITVHFTDSLAYFGWMSVPDVLQDNGVATAIVSDDFIPYCFNTLGVTAIHGVAKSPEMATVFEKVGFTENPQSEGGWYTLEKSDW